MDAIFSSLGELLLKALPTFILLILLHFYLKWAFYGPMDRLLKKRWEATEGAREAAEDSLAKADEKAQSYERAVREARAEIYQEQEEMRRRREQEQARSYEQVRQEVEATVRQQKADLAADAEAARASLRAESEALAESIAGAVLERRAG